jgi:MFS family permease
MSRPDALAPLREQNFRWYFLSRTVNMAGSTMASVALAFAVLEVSDSPSALGTVLAAMSIPMVVFLLVGGVIADRFGRTLVIQSANVVSGLCQLSIAALVLSGHAQVWQLVCLAAVIGTSSAMSFPAIASVLPQLVPREHLQQANVLISMMRGTLTVVGPSVAGVLVVTAGPGWALAVDGTTRRRCCSACGSPRPYGGRTSPPSWSSCARAGPSSGPPPGSGPSCSRSWRSTRSTPARSSPWARCSPSRAPSASAAGGWSCRRRRWGCSR